MKTQGNEAQKAQFKEEEQNKKKMHLRTKFVS